MITVEMLESLQANVWDLGQRIDAPRGLLVVRGAASGTGDPYVDFDGERFLYVISERGVELIRKSVDSLNELLYLIFSDVVSRMAMDFELDHRVVGQDVRWTIFSKMIELMHELDPSWGAEMQKETEEVLRLAAYDDGGK